MLWAVSGHQHSAGQDYDEVQGVQESVFRSCSTINFANANLYNMIIYSNRIDRNAIIEIIARGGAECDNWNNRISPNPIPVLSNDKMRL